VVAIGPFVMRFCCCLRLNNWFELVLTGCACLFTCLVGVRFINGFVYKRLIADIVLPRSVLVIKSDLESLRSLDCLTNNTSSYGRF